MHPLERPVRISSLQGEKFLDHFVLRKSVQLRFEVTVANRYIELLDLHGISLGSGEEHSALGEIERGKIDIDSVGIGVEFDRGTFL